MFFFCLKYLIKKSVYLLGYTASLKYFSVKSQHLMFTQCSSQWWLKKSQASSLLTVSPILTLVTEFRTDQTPKPAGCGFLSCHWSFGSSRNLARPLLPEGLCVVSWPKTKSLRDWGKPELYGSNHTKAMVKLWAECITQLKAFWYFRMIRAPSRGQLTLQ